MALEVKNLPANAGDIKDMGSIPGLGRSTGEGNDNPTLVSLLRQSHEQWSLVGHSPRGCKELDMTERVTQIGHTTGMP